MGEIYKISHSATDRVYVGQTTQKNGCRSRWYNHCKRAADGMNTYFYRAIRKYGREAFTVEVIEVCSDELLNDRESFWISEFRSNQKGFGFNSTSGGDRCEMTSDAKRNMSISATGRKRGPLSESARRKISDAKKGKRRTSEQIERIKQGRSHIVNLSETWKQNISKGLLNTAKYKLSHEEAIKVLYDPGPVEEIARKYGVSRKTLWRIKKHFDHPAFYDLKKNGRKHRALVEGD